VGKYSTSFLGRHSNWSKNSENKKASIQGLLDALEYSFLNCGAAQAEVPNFYLGTSAGISKGGPRMIGHGQNSNLRLSSAGVTSRRLANVLVTVFYPQKVTNCDFLVTNFAILVTNSPGATYISNENR
jgi:hypothetical protein